MRRLLVILVLLLPATAHAADVADATGRVVPVPDTVARVLPAGPPAALLIEALAPDLLLGWPSVLNSDTRALLSPASAARPTVPRLTGHDDVTAAIAAFKPDLIVDYGDVTPEYVALAKTTQAKTGVPTLLFDGALPEIPHTLRVLGAALHREQRAEMLATYAEALLSLPIPHGRKLSVLYARGPDGLTVAEPGTDITEVFDRLGWQAVAPEGHGTFRHATLAAIAALDPDMLVFGDAHMRETIAASPEWRALRAVREGHALIAPSLPFGWIEEPPSLNRLLGWAWLGGHEPATLAATFSAVMYGHVLSPAELQSVTDPARPLPH